MPHLTLLFIGDVFGKPGRDLVRIGIPKLVRRYEVTAVIANGENSAGGFGITRETGEELFAAGIDLMTSGNHVWDKKEALDYLPLEPRLVRPANFPAGVPGNGSAIMRTAEGEEVAVLNLMGRVFMNALDDPFSLGTREAARLRARTPIVLVDMHAEATSEKIAMGWHLAGKVSAVVGTHIIGVEREPVINRFLTGLPSRFEAAKGMPKLHAVVITADTTTGEATSIERISLTRAALEDM